MDAYEEVVGGQDVSIGPFLQLWVSMPAKSTVCTMVCVVCVCVCGSVWVNERCFCLHRVLKDL